MSRVTIPGGTRLGTLRIIRALIAVAIAGSSVALSASTALASARTSAPNTVQRNTSNLCVAAGLSYPLVDKIFGKGTQLSAYSGFGAYNFCAVAPFQNPGGYVEVIVQPKSSFATLVHHYVYLGHATPTAGLSGAVWYRAGAVIDVVVFLAGKHAISLATNIARPPYPAKPQYLALATAIRAHLGK